MQQGRPIVATLEQPIHRIDDPLAIPLKRGPGKSLVDGPANLIADPMVRDELDPTVTWSIDLLCRAEKVVPLQADLLAQAWRGEAPRAAPKDREEVLASCPWFDPIGDQPRAVLGHADREGHRDCDRAGLTQSLPAHPTRIRSCRGRKRDWI